MNEFITIIMHLWG